MLILLKSAWMHITRQHSLVKDNPISNKQTMFLILENKRKNDSTAILEGNLRINRLYLNKITTKITLCEFFYKASRGRERRYSS